MASSSASAAFAAIPKPVTSSNKSIVPVGGRLGAVDGLTLTNGMTAGYGTPGDIAANPSHVSNPLVHPWTYGGNPKYQVNRIGLIRNIVAGTSGPSALKQYTLNFMFNPNLITVSFEINQASIPANYVYNSSGPNAGEAVGSTAAGASATNSLNNLFPNLVNAQSVSWSLIFDRTYDMMYGPNPNYQRGVLADLAALYNIMATYTSAGVPMSTPVEVIFGQNGAGQLWGFTGFLTVVNIEYGIFKHNMMPSRCEVDLTLTAVHVEDDTPALPTLKSTNTGPGGATTTTPGKTGAVGPEGPVNTSGTRSLNGPVGPVKVTKASAISGSPTGAGPYSLPASSIQTVPGVGPYGPVGPDKK